MPSKPIASVIIPNFNGRQHLQECLGSLTELDYPADAYEVLLVDNASTDGSADFVRKEFPHVRVLRQGTNLGFAAGCNAGAEQAQGDLLAFLNNDMRVDPDWLRELGEPLRESGSLAATSGLILSWDGKKVDFAGGTVNFYGHGFQNLYGRPVEEGRRVRPGPILFPCGGSMAVRREVFQRAAGFDEEYFAYFEDVDLGWRLWVMGHEVRLVPSAISYHRGGATGGGMPVYQRRVLYERNALATIIKNYDDENLARVLPAAFLLMGKRALTVGGFPASSYRVWAESDGDHQQVSKLLLSYMVALGDLADGGQRLWTKRATIQAARRRPDRDILPLLESPFASPCLEPDYLQVQAGLEHLLRIPGMFPRLGRSRVLIVSDDPVAKRMAGPGIRAWEMANTLARSQLVTLAVPNSDPPDGEGLRVVPYAGQGGDALRELASQHDVIVVQGFVLDKYPVLAQAHRPLVVDLYDPFTLENLHLFPEDGIDLRTHRHNIQLGMLNSHLAGGDFFLCASETQRDYWIGMLAAVGRVNPKQHRADPTLRSLIDIVPFGVSSRAPRAGQPVLKGVYAGISSTDRVVLWGGGIWEWFDPLTLIRAVARIRQTRPEVKAFFLGVGSPNPAVPAMPMAERAEALARELGQLGEGVFFNHDWVPYDERGAYLLEADVGVSLHADQLETRYSFRTRVLDYIWAGLPIICTRGDAVSQLVADQGLGRVVDYGDIAGLAEAICEIIDTPKGKIAYSERLRTAAEGLNWERVVEPLARFCQNPLFAADHVGEIPPGLLAAAVPGHWPSAASSVPLAPPWLLPARALQAFRSGGFQRLWGEAKSYMARRRAGVGR